MDEQTEDGNTITAPMAFEMLTKVMEGMNKNSTMIFSMIKSLDKRISLLEEMQGKLLGLIEKMVLDK